MDRDRLPHLIMTYQSCGKRGKAKSSKDFSTVNGTGAGHTGPKNLQAIWFWWVKIRMCWSARSRSISHSRSVIPIWNSSGTVSALTSSAIEGLTALMFSCTLKREIDCFLRKLNLFCLFLSVTGLYNFWYLRIVWSSAVLTIDASSWKPLFCQTFHARWLTTCRLIFISFICSVLSVQNIRSHMRLRSEGSKILSLISRCSSVSDMSHKYL